MKNPINLIIFALLPLSLIAGEYPDISINELQKAIKKGDVAIIDVNGARTYEHGHIPTAIHFSSVYSNCFILWWSWLPSLQERCRCSCKTWLQKH